MYTLLIFINYQLLSLNIYIYIHITWQCADEHYLLKIIKECVTDVHKKFTLCAFNI